MDEMDRQAILIVDDSLLVCQQIRAILKKENLIIREAHSGKEALDELKGYCPDLILLDVVLPDAEGYDLCSMIKERDMNNAQVIFITSKDGDEDVVKGFSMGACDYIKKPFGHEEFRSRILVHLGMKKQKDELNRINKELQSNMEKLNSMVFRDGLTGLYNRRYVIDDLINEIKCYDEPDVKNVLIMADVDDFKKVNDQYGHEAGDMALICIANIMENICRRHKVVRWGGEEFLVVLFAVTEQEAVEICECIRREVEAFEFKHNDSQFACRMTLGLCIYDESKDLKWSIERADKALYKGKKSGKNCSMWYDGWMEAEMEHE